MSIKKDSFFSFTRKSFKEKIEQNDLKSFVADQVFTWIYKRREFNLDNWTNVSKIVKSFLLKNFSFDLPKVILHKKSIDGTRKFLVSFDDNKTVETVLIPAKNRLTICLSTQVGCAIGCTFCHTGEMGFLRHLTNDEIVGEFLAIQVWLKENSISNGNITNMVYMGQGEPLHNFQNVKEATEIFLDDLGLGFGQRRITLSTSGMVPQIKKLSDFPPINIAISLHAAHDNIRSELMPINKVYDLNRLLEAIKEIPLKAHRWITYEYLLIDGLNDRQEDIDALISLLSKKTSKVNLIPFNEYPQSKFKRPTIDKIKWFNQSLNDKGLISTIRATKGKDILAACGQLKSRNDNILPKSQTINVDQI